MKRKNWFKRILTVFLAVLCVFFAGCADTNEVQVPRAPDYRKNSKNDKEFTFYAYSSVSTGKQTRKDENGNRYTVELGPDCITLEKFQEYKECGLQILMPQSLAVVGRPSNYTDPSVVPLWKTILDLAEQTDLKVILTDNILMYASSGQYTDAALYESETAMDKYVREQLMLYVQHPAFYGVLLRDEVSAAQIKSGTFGKVYHSIKRVEKALQNEGVIDKEVFIHINVRGMGSYFQGYSDHTGDQFPEISREEYYDLLPGLEYKDPATETDAAFYARVDALYAATPSAEKEGLRYVMQRARYRRHLELLIEATGSNHFAIDLYPLYQAPMTVYLQSLQIGAEVAEEYGVEYHIVTQATSFNNGGNTRILSAADMRWLNNTLLGYGVSTICYYGYFQPGPTCLEGSSFLLYSGEKTPMWEACQNLMKENRAFESTILNFDFKASKGYIKEGATYNAGYVKYLPAVGEFSVLKDFTWDKETALVTELYDKKRKNYMYMAFNAVDPIAGTEQFLQTSTLTFDEKYTSAVVWKNGTSKNVRLSKSNSLTVKNYPGEATYVIPY